MDTSSGWLGSWCTSRICEGSAAEIAASLEQRVARDPQFAVANASLEVTAPGATGAVATMGPRRVHAARLRFSRWRVPAKVTLEIERWSADACELLVRPGRRAPVRSDAYLGAALALVEAVAIDLELARMSVTTGPAADGRGGLRRAS
ncbi:MAG: hypothetical protein WDA60_10970 [Acidimicrobiia bacterium]|jgi:hypothetical protein